MKPASADKALVNLGMPALRAAVQELCRTDFLVFQKVELGLTLGPQHKVWADHLATGLDVVELAPRDHGKLVAHSELVRTPEGWVRHGDLRPEDRVYTPEGKPVRIKGISTEGLASLKVSFSNGASTKVHPNHEWEVVDRRHSRHGDCVKVLETKQLQEEGLYLAGKDQRARWWLPNIQALQQEKQALPIDPYVLGVWLGDGDKYGRWICQGQQDAAEIFKAVEETETFEKDYLHRETGVVSRIYQGFRDRIKVLDLEGNKHVPEIYLRGSAQQRLELLAGLIDTDGCVEQVRQRGRNYATRRVRFVNTNARLIEDIKELAKGLGFRTSESWAEPSLSSSGVQGKEKVCYLRITPTLDVPTRLSRKKILGLRGRDLPRISITAIEPCEPEPGRCIEIDDPRGVYLIGKDLIPTHNSHSLIRAYALWRVKYSPWVKEVLILGPDQPTAVENLDKIKDFLNNCPTLNYLVPKKRRDTFFSRTEVQLTNGKTIKAKGIGSPLRGRHPQLILLDDVLNEGNSLTPEHQAEMRRYIHSVVLPMKDKGLATSRQQGFSSQMVIAGTAQSRTDFYHEALESGLYAGTKLAAILDETLGTVLWPERYTLDDLLKIRTKIGTLVFSQEYLNEPLSDDTTIFPTTLFEAGKDRDLSYVSSYSGTNPVYMGVDFSVPGNSDGDWTVIFIIEYDDELKAYRVLNYWRERPDSTQRQIHQIELMTEMYRVTLGYLEDNMFQGIYANIFKQKSALPLSGHTVTHSGKASVETGVLSFRPLLENGAIIFPYKTAADQLKTDAIVTEFNGVTQRRGKIGNESFHDDIVMAFWHAICAARAGTSFNVSWD